MFSFSHCIVFIALFGPALVSSFMLSLKDGNDTVTAPPQSNVSVIWVRTTDSDPTQDTIELVLIDPGGNKTSFFTGENGEEHGEANVLVGDPGNYMLFARDDALQDHFLTSMNFTVLAPAADNSSTSAPSTPGASGSSTSPVAQSSKSESSGSGTSNAPPTSMTSTTTTTGAESSSFPQGNFTGDSTTDLFPTPTNGSSTDDSSANNSSDASAKLSSSSGPHTGMIVGVVLGALAAIALILALFWFLHRRRKQQRPVSFHREMMVRSPSVYPASLAASSFSMGHPDGRQRTSSDLLARAGSVVVPASVLGSSPPSMSPFRDISSLERGSSHRDSSIHTIDIQRSSVDSGMPRPLVESISASPTAFRSPLHTPSDPDSREYWIKNSR